LSNTGGKEITETTLVLGENAGDSLLNCLNVDQNNWRSGQGREEISFYDLEPLIAAGAFNEEGGLQFSRVIEKNLVDVFVPFLPMERQHVRVRIMMIRNLR
jgi:hypothetical protein